MTRFLSAAAVALAIGATQFYAMPTMASDMVVVDVKPMASELARHLQVTPDKIPATVELPAKLAAGVCETSLGQLRQSENARCTATSMSQGLIKAVRQSLRG